MHEVTNALYVVLIYVDKDTCNNIGEYLLNKAFTFQSPICEVGSYDVTF